MKASFNFDEEILFFSSFYIMASKATLFMLCAYNLRLTPNRNLWFEHIREALIEYLIIFDGNCARVSVGLGSILRHNHKVLF